MMEEALRALLAGDPGIAGLVGGRIYPVERPQGSALPAITYHLVSSVPGHAMGGLTGLVDARVQIDAWAEPSTTRSSYDTAKRIGRAVRAALGGFRGTVGGTDIGGIFLEDEDDGRADGAGDVARLHRNRTDIRIWHREVTS